MKKELIILSVLMVIAMFVISGCSSGNAIKGAKKDVSLKTTEPVKIVRNQSFCNDTDGGLNYYEYGIVTLSNGEVSYDECAYVMSFGTNISILDEKYCTSSGGIGTIANFCQHNGCVNGVCINNGTIPHNVSIVNNTINATR